MREYWEIFVQLLKPRFHEMSTYLIALSFCWLIILHPELRRSATLFFTHFGPLYIFLGLIFTAGLILSLIHVFIKQKKSAVEKGLMGWTILGISSLASFLVGAEMMPSQSFFITILITWNILMSLLLFIQMGTQKYEISDQETSCVEVIATTAILVVILIVSDKYLGFSWPMTLSICIFYSTIIVFITSWVIYTLNLRIPNIEKENGGEQ